ncbi:hypothetical protein [Parasitella parasitica]|uniref:Protein S-acyltransferase n=1 Tax=Parasitella parasitica TaxID=35722 RepID=A0A0B7MWH0_9FUNG|nr:hypothetical protein [Parasitella parasitica]
MYMKSSKNDETQTDFDDPDEQDAQTCCCCQTDSPMYANLWPLIFFFSALTDFPMPLPKGKKPGQHRDWGWVPVLIVTGMAAFVYYGYLHGIFFIALAASDRYSFLCYVSLFAAFTFSTSLAAFIEFHGLSTFDNVALAIIIISGIITLMIGTFTMSHIWLVVLNRTTIENSQFQSWNKAKKFGNANNRLIKVFTESGKNVFNQGCWNNWVEVMGSNAILWFLPFSSKQVAQTDGIHFGYNQQVLQEYRNENAARRKKPATNDEIDLINSLEHGMHHSVTPNL